MKKTLALILAAIIAALSLSSCGAASGDKNFAEAAPPEGADYGWYDSADYDFSLADVEDAEMEADAAYEPSAPAPNASSAASAPADTARKIIKNGSLEIETLDFDRFTVELEASVASFGGYIESSSTYGSGTRYSNYTVRIPSENYDAFFNAVGELGTITRASHDTEDATLKYVDIEARLKALTAERDSFMSLMERAQTVDEILQIQSYLTDVNYEIESYTSQLNTLKNLVSYSTVRITVDEVQRITPAEPKTVWERISSNLSENMYDIGVGFTNLFVSAVSSLPYLIILAVFVGIVAGIVVAIVKSSNKKQRARNESAAQNKPQPESEENKQ